MTNLSGQESHHQSQLLILRSWLGMGNDHDPAAGNEIKINQEELKTIITRQRLTIVEKSPHRSPLLHSGKQSI